MRKWLIVLMAAVAIGATGILAFPEASAVKPM